MGSSNEVDGMASLTCQAVSFLCSVSGLFGFGNEHHVNEIMKWFLKMLLIGSLLRIIQRWAYTKKYESTLKKLMEKMEFKNLILVQKHF